MTIAQAIECGCARKGHKDTTDIDIVGNPRSFATPPVAVIAYMSTITTNCAHHPVIHSAYDIPGRFHTPECSMRHLRDKVMSMGHTSDERLIRSIATAFQSNETSSFCMHQSGCATRFGEIFSETQVAMTETAVCTVRTVQIIFFY